jgi:hypothetical protein
MTELGRRSCRSVSTDSIANICIAAVTIKIRSANIACTALRPGGLLNIGNSPVVLLQIVDLLDSQSCMLRMSSIFFSISRLESPAPVNSLPSPKGFNNL